MKKSLLLMLMLVPLLCSAQKLVQIKSFGYQYYDAVDKQYLSRRAYIAKYGQPQIISLVAESFSKGEIKEHEIPLVLDANYKVVDNTIVDARDPNAKIQGYNPISMSKSSKINMAKQSIKMKPINLTIGCSIIGVSATGYMVASAAINDKTRKNNNSILANNVEMAKLSAESQPNVNKIKELTEATNKLHEKNNKLDKSKSTAGYICGATSLAGVIVVLTGLHRDYYGVPVSSNTYINSTDKGLSASIVF